LQGVIPGALARFSNPYALLQRGWLLQPV
jgi:hypothetical protein